MDRNHYVDLRQSYLALQVKFVKGLGYETHISKEIEEEHKIDAKEDEQTEEEVQESPVFLVFYVHNILRSIFSNVEVYIKNQQIYKSNGLPAHKY